MARGEGREGRGRTRTTALALGGCAALASVAAYAMTAGSGSKATMTASGASLGERFAANRAQMVARRRQARRFCGSYVRVEQQNAKDVVHVERCYGRTVLAQEPEYKYQIVNNPNLTAAGRQKPFVALDFKNSASAADITVVTSVYNAAPALEKSLPYLFLKTTGSWEFVLVLDACYDASYSTAVKLLQSYFEGSSCVRARIIIQPTAVWEVSSDNIGMRASSPRYAYILYQADTVMEEKGWDERMLVELLSNNKIFAISGRCGHSIDLKETVGRCGSDVSERLGDDVPMHTFYVTETVNRGPLLLRSHTTQKLGFLDESRFLLGDDDHDLNARARKLGFIVGYLPINFYAPLDLSARRNPQYRSHTPLNILQNEAAYKAYRLEYARENF
jgi:hypothetical protein